MRIRNCPDCTEEFSIELDRCPHCHRPSFFPNVDEASGTDETDALDQRYTSAIEAARAAGRLDAVNALEQRLSNSEACKAMPRWELDRLVSATGAVAPTYYQQISGQCRLPDGDEWDRLRRIADAAFFKSYGTVVHFAALSTGGRWLSHYGDGAVFFREDKISHRATLFDENTARWANAQSGQLEIPLGHRATWPQRARLGVAKLASAIVTGEDSEIDDHLLSCGATSSSDEFIEVHIYGSFTIRSVRALVIRSGAVSELSRQALSARAHELNLKVDEIP